MTQAELDAATALKAEVGAGRNISRPFVMVAPQYPGGGDVGKWVVTRDPVTGEPILDPETGEPVLEWMPASLVPDPDQADPTYAPLSGSEGAKMVMAQRNEELADIEADLQHQIDTITTHNGVDTNWGFGDLSIHSVVRVNATVEQLAKAEREWDDDTQDVFATRKQIARRYWRIDYAAFMSAAEIAAVQDPAVLVNVDRAGTPVPVGLATTRTVRDMIGNPPGSGDGSDPT